MSTITERSAGRAEQRLLRPITFVEAILLLVSLAATIFAYPRIAAWAYGTVYHLDGYEWFFSFALLGMAAPGFALPFVLMAITPWRYKAVAGVLATFVLIFYGVRFIVWN